MKTESPISQRLTLLGPTPDAEAPKDCVLCPRLAEFREEVRAEFPDWWNAPVPAFGDPEASLAIIGLAPGKHGAHRTGRPFTGDYAGDLLYATLAKFGLSQGTYDSRVDDGMELRNAVILNAVKCLPPQNKPTPAEIKSCQPFLTDALDALPQVRVFIALGNIAHQSLVRMMGGKQAAYKFGHMAEHVLPDGRILIDSYHCSRYNTNTKRLTPEMFEAVFARAGSILAA